MAYKIIIFFPYISFKIDSVTMAMQYILHSYKEKIYQFYFTPFHNAIGINRTLTDKGLREKYKINLVTLLRKRGKEHHVVGVPKGDTVIEEEDLIMVFGSVKNISSFIDINQ